MISWPPSLITDLARRRTVLLIGSGVSKHSVTSTGSRPPTWHEFLTQAILDCPGGAPSHIGQALDQGDYLHACELLKVRFDEGWIPYLRRIFQEPGYPPAQIHQALLSLDCRVVFTLNFDDIYERAAKALNPGSHIVKNYYDSDAVEFLKGTGRYIVKVHGSLDSPAKLIFTQADYARARTNNSFFYQAFDAALMTHSFLFVGAGYSDPDVNLLLENQKFSSPSNQPHYFLTSGISSDDLKNSLRNNRNLKVIEYDKLDSLHTGLVQEMTALGTRVDYERQALGVSTNW